MIYLPEETLAILDPDVCQGWAVVGTSSGGEDRIVQYALTSPGAYFKGVRMWLNGFPRYPNSFPRQPIVIGYYYMPDVWDTVVDLMLPEDFDD